MPVSHSSWGCLGWGWGIFFSDGRTSWVRLWLCLLWSCSRIAIGCLARVFSGWLPRALWYWRRSDQRCSLSPCLRWSWWWLHYLLCFSTISFSAWVITSHFIICRLSISGQVHCLMLLSVVFRHRTGLRTYRCAGCSRWVLLLPFMMWMVIMIYCLLLWGNLRYFWWGSCWFSHVFFNLFCIYWRRRHRRYSRWGIGWILLRGWRLWRQRSTRCAFTAGIIGCWWGSGWTRRGFATMPSYFYYCFGVLAQTK